MRLSGSARVFLSIVLCVFTLVSGLGTYSYAGRPVVPPARVDCAVAMGVNPIEEAAKLKDIPPSPNKVIAAVKRIFQYWETEASVWHFTKEKTRPKQVLRLTHEVLIKAVRFLSPVPLRFSKTPTEGIFKKQWKNHKYEPTDEEWKKLDDYEARDEFLKKRAFISDHRIWKFFRRTVQKLGQAALWISLAMVANQVYAMHDHVYTPMQFLTDPQLELQPTQVQLLLETGGIPFGRVSLRMGDQVFYIKDSTLMVQTAAEYFYGSDPFGPSLASSQRRAESDRRSIQSVTLGMTSEEFNALAANIAGRLWRNVDDLSHSGNSSSAFFKMIEESTAYDFPWAVDQSPAQIFMTLAAAFLDPPYLGLLGKMRVGPVSLIVVEGSANPYRALFKNAYWNAMESKIEIKFLPVLEVWDVVK